MGHRVRCSAGFLALFFAAFFCAPLVEAQTTQVTGQVLDANGLPYAGAQMKAGLVFAGTPVSNPTVQISSLSQCKANGFGSAPCQVPFNPSNGPFNLDGGGNIPGGGITLQDNSLVTPSGTQWAFTVSTAGNPPPIGTGPQTCSATLTVTGASQSVSSSFNACPRLSNSSGGISPTAPAAPLGYYLSSSCKDLGITNAFCFNTPANTQIAQGCTYTTASPTVTCPTPTVRGVSASVTSNVATYTYAPNTFPTWLVGNSITVTGFTAGDTFFNQTCTLTVVGANSVSCALTHANASSTTSGTIVNNTAGPFVAADAGAGKRIFGYNTCSAFVPLNNNLPITTGTALTISTFVSSRQITMSGNAANSSNGGLGGGCVIWGNPDDAAAAAMDAAMQSAPQCPFGHLAAAFYMFTTFHFIGQPLGCQSLPSLANGALGFGNLAYYSGYEIEGRGSGATTIFLTPSFPETGSCTNGVSLLACFAVPPEARFSGFQLSGGGNFTSPNFTSGHYLMEVDGPANLDFFTCTNFGTGTAGTVGIAGFVFAQITQPIASACGDKGIGIGKGPVTVIRADVENVSSNYLFVGLPDSANVFAVDQYNVTMYDPLFNAGPGHGGLAPNIIRDNTGNKIKLYHPRISNFGATVNGTLGYNCTGAGCVLDIDSGYLDMTVAGQTTTTGDYGIFCGSACTVFIKNSLIKGVAPGFAYKDVAGSILYDQGGNTWGAFPTILGQVIGEANSANAILVTAPKLVLSAGWGSTAAVTALAGGDFPISFTITNSGTGQAANPTITYTFPTPLAVPPISCTAVDLSGTNPIGTFTTSGLSTTGATFTFSLTPTAADTENMQVTCVTP